VTGQAAVDDRDVRDVGALGVLASAVQEDAVAVGVLAVDVVEPDVPDVACARVGGGDGEAAADLQTVGLFARVKVGEGRLVAVKDEIADRDVRAVLEDLDQVP
jgi:hypothetical protein